MQILSYNSLDTSDSNAEEWLLADRTDFVSDICERLDRRSHKRSDKYSRRDHKKKANPRNFWEYKK